jgi:DNA-binding response OmpR family regulator
MLTPMRAKTVLLISSDPQTIQTYLLLHSAPDAAPLRWAPGLREGLRLLAGPDPFEGVLLDLSLGEDGLRRVRSLRSRLPVTVLTEPGEERRGLAALAAGAAEYRVKGSLGAPARRMAYALAAA